MRSQAKELQNKLADESVTIKAAGDQVLMTMDGNLKMTGLAIDKDMLNPDNQNKLQEAIKKAHEEAMKKIQRIMAMKMKEMGGMPNIPGMS